MNTSSETIKAPIKGLNFRVVQQNKTQKLRKNQLKQERWPCRPL